MRGTVRGLVAAFFLLCVGTTGAQDWWWGFRGGPSIPQLSGGNNVVSEGYHSILAPNIGFCGEYMFNSHYSVEFELDYAGQGGERDGLQPITGIPAGLIQLPPGQYLYADFKNKSVLEYLEIPIMGKYQWGTGRHWRWFVEAGPYAGFLLRAVQHTTGMSHIYADANRTPMTSATGGALPEFSLDAETDVMDSLNHFNWGIVGGLGAAYLIDNRSEVFFDARGEYGFMTVQSDPIDGQSNTGCAVLSVGYKVAVGM